MGKKVKKAKQKKYIYIAKRLEWIILILKTV